jgi:hypothetical protein
MKLGTFKVHHICTECVKYAFVSSMGFPATVHGAMYPIDRICCSKDLTKQWKRRRVNCCQQLLKKCQSKNFLETMVTVDETWVHHYDPESKIASMQWKTPGSPTPVKPRAQKSAGKVMLTVFWDAKGVILKEYLPHGNTVNGHYYADLLTKVRKAVIRKRGIARTQNLPLLQDNAPSHKAI